MSDQHWKRMYDRFEDVTRVASAMMPLAIAALPKPTAGPPADEVTTAQVKDQCFLAIRLDAAGDRHSPYVDAGTSRFKSADATMSWLENVARPNFRYDHAYVILTYVGADRFRFAQPCHLLLDRYGRQTLSHAQRIYQQAGLDGRPTESLIYGVDFLQLQRLSQARSLEARVADVEFAMTNEGISILEAYRAVLFG